MTTSFAQFAELKTHQFPVIHVSNDAPRPEPDTKGPAERPMDFDRMAREEQAAQQRHF